MFALDVPGFVPQIIILLFFSLVIGKSSELIVGFLSRLSRQIHLTEFITSFIVLGVATSTPEIFVAVGSGIERVPELSLGNLIGGIIILFSLILGSTALFGGSVDVSHNLGKKELWTLVFFLISPLVVILDGNLSRFDGLSLVFLYIFYVSMLKKEKHFWPNLVEKIVEAEGKIFKNMFFLLLGIAGLFISAKVIVDTSIDLSQKLNLPKFLVGLLFLPIGTNLPEIVLSLQSIFKKHKSLAVGDFLGSAAANVLIVGFLGLIMPFEIKSLNKILISLLIVTVVLPVFVIFSRTQNKLTRIEGAVLISFYIGFIALELFLR